jgi:putrescine importer
VATVGSGMGSQIGAARLLYAMGRGNAIPKKFFGAIDAKRHIPRNNVIFSGVLALLGALTLDFARGVDLLNFGALIAFMGVNAAALVHYYIRSRTRRLSDLLPPVMGFLICLLLWWNLNPRAKLLGTAWMLLGLAYGAIRTRGFRGELVSFDISSAVEE